ncbi:succinoglycan biosynthesis protein ExoM [Sphingomonas kaistensis]|uniref:Succinoglycan biosynthesis protein ExoM n=1 Tax=Sphingomonas kaistensis TaxID=298708 RepID=A0A7X5Y4E0_9SPHN|nr:succinoglycan biosynthesis protein ExoM [Sphingomonas kaistensis]
MEIQLEKRVSAGGERVKIAVAVCTFKRNDLLARLLTSLEAAARQVADQAEVGVALVDDTPEGQARPVAEAFADRFGLGLAYAISGKKNISLARNLALETAIGMADWTAMTDDDCEVPSHWLEAMLAAQQSTGAQAVTGRMVRRVPEGSPKWIVDEPFLELGVDEWPDGAELTSAATFNTMISNEWLKRHSDVRFDPHFGVIGGEDMVFFRAAHAAGLTIRYAKQGFVYENEPADRATLAYQLYAYFWHGNSAALSSMQSGVSRGRMTVHAGASLARAFLRPVKRLASGQKPQLRFTLAQILHATGKGLGTFGLRVEHR